MDLQIEIRFARAPAGGTQFAWGALRAFLRDLRQDGRIKDYHFLRKPPGVRLRLLNAVDPIGVIVDAVKWSDLAIDSNWIGGYHFSKYEAESTRFGGAYGVQVAEEGFCRDSERALDLISAKATERISDMEYRTISVDFVDRLFVGVCDDPAELREAWMLLRAVVGVEGDDSAWLSNISRSCSIREGVSLSEVLGKSYFILADELSVKLRALHRAGLLHVGRREWMVSFVVYHWNRLGFEESDMPELLRCRHT